MPFDPAQPAQGSPKSSAVMRAQLNGLKDLIDAIQTIGSATVDAVNTLPPGDPASASVTLTANALHFTFDLPQGDVGDPGEPGEVTLQQLDDAIADTSHNCVTVDMLEMSVSDPPTQSEVQLIADKLDQLINTLQR